MRAKLLIGVFAVAVLVNMAGCVMPDGRSVIPAPAIYVQPAPVVEVAPAVLAPEAYILVNGEYIGWYGDRYMYLGPGNVWIVCDDERLGRFHEWERHNPGYRQHAMRGRENNRGNNRHDKKDQRQ